MKLFNIRTALSILCLVLSLGLFTNQAMAYGIYTGGTYGNDFSYPQCSATSYPQQTFNIVGVTSGRAFQYNSCFGSEYKWATGLTTQPSVYMNLNAPIGTTASKGMSGYYGKCAKSNKACQAKNYGYNAAQDAYNYVVSSLSTTAYPNPAMWWLDIETSNSWESKTTLNQDVIDGATQFFTNQKIPVGIYSTASMWNSITGKYQNKLPTWVATNSTITPSSCPASFTGGTTYILQYNNSSGFDADFACL